MARDQDDSIVNDRLLDRRTLIKTTAVGAAGLAGLAASGEAAAASYRTVTVPTNGHKTFSVGNGETLENLLIDITASGASCHISAVGNGWTIQNVGVKGAQDSLGTLCTVSVPDANSTGTLKNVYFGDGCIYQSGQDGQSVGIWVDGTGSNAHRGTLQVDGLNLGDFINNGFYGSGSGMISDLGSINVSSSYFRSNNIDQLRLGRSSNSTYQVSDSVIIARKGEVVAEGPDNGGRVTNGRGVWSHDGTGTVVVDNCDIYSDWTALAVDSGNGMVAKNSRVTGNIDSGVDTQNVTGNPDLTPPSGVPMKAEDAASGSTSSTSSTSSSTTTSSSTSTSSNTISLWGGSGSNVLSYSFTVTDSLSKSKANGGSINKGDTISGSTATGEVAGGVDSYSFAGDISSFTADDGVNVSVNGKQVDPSTLGSSSDLPNTISIHGGSGSHVIHYKLTVSGSLKKSTANDATIDTEDTISGSTATGAVAGGVDSYAFSGDVTSFSADDRVRITVNGKRVRQSSL